MFWGKEPVASFQLFGIAHLCALAVGFIVLLLLYRFRQKLRAPELDKKFRWVFIGLIVFTNLLYQTWLITTDAWTLRTSLPFSICECAAVICILMLATKSKRLFEMGYFIGAVISFFVILTPALDFSFPQFRFIEFFLAHELTVITPLYMIFVHQYVPTKKSLWRTLLIMNIFLPLIIVLNRLTGGNYWFIADAPKQKTLLSIIAPFPWNLLELNLALIIVFHLFLLPFKFKTK